ncbi:hypothetical protein BC938DRAFT_478327, partial [Jimgerdemannia flammicorona]
QDISQTHALALPCPHSEQTDPAGLCHDHRPHISCLNLLHHIHPHTAPFPTVLRKITENSRRPAEDREDDYTFLPASPSKKRKTSDTSTFAHLGPIPFPPLSLNQQHSPTLPHIPIDPRHDQNAPRSRDQDALVAISSRPSQIGNGTVYQDAIIASSTAHDDQTHPSTVPNNDPTLPAISTGAPSPASKASPRSPCSPCSPPYWDIPSPDPGDDSPSSPSRSFPVETSSLLPVTASSPIADSTPLAEDLSSARPRRTTSTSTTSSVTRPSRRSKPSMQPRWHTQSYMVFLALRQHPAKCLPRTQLIKAALEMDKKISEERGLPRVFRGKDET